MAQKLKQPPFPPLTWDEFQWSAKAAVPPLAARKVALAVQVPTDADADEPEPVPPTAEQGAAFAHLLEHTAEVRAALLAAILEYLKELADDYPPLAKLVAEVGTDAEKLAGAVRLTDVLVLEPAADGVAYVGYEFACWWDDGGVGVIAHRARAVHVGPGEDAGDDTAATRDARRLKRASNKRN